MARKRYKPEEIVAKLRQVGLRSGFLLPQDPDDLLFRETTWLHVHPPAGDGLTHFKFRWGLSYFRRTCRSLLRISTTTT